MTLAPATRALRAVSPHWRAVALLSAMAAAILTSSLPAEAAGSSVCRRLEAELANARRGEPSARAQRYDAAIQRQREQMAIARQQARDAGCGYTQSRTTIRHCASIATTLERMARNLESLERNRARMDRARPKRSSEAILAALDANGCFDEVVEPEPTPLGEMLDEASRFDDPGLADPLEAEAATGERFRTLCVRTCDGYFYPMSNGATVTEFERDRRNCEASCPGTEMQIFYGPQGSEDVGAMVSTRNGAPYASMPTAFMHQNVSMPRPAQCGCGVKKEFEIVAGAPPARREQPAVSETGGAESRDADAEEDAPEAAAAVEPATPSKPSGSFWVAPPKEPEEPPSTGAASQAAAPPAAAPASPAPERRVRVVGPEFLPDPAEAIDLRTKAQSSDP